MMRRRRHIHDDVNRVVRVQLPVIPQAATPHSAAARLAHPGSTSSTRTISNSGTGWAALIMTTPLTLCTAWLPSSLVHAQPCGVDRPHTAHRCRYRGSSRPTSYRG
jgi:hypothetical protein